MDNLIETIRLATISDATDEARATGAHACRTLLLALDAHVGEPLAAPPPTTDGTAMPPFAAVVGALRGMPPEQLLDLAIARLRAALPADAAPPAVSSLKFQLVPVLPTSAKRPA